LRKRKRMAERDQLVRTLGRHDAGKPRRAEHVALLGVALEHEVERRLRHPHAAFGHGNTLGRGFLRDVDHACLARLTEMGKFSGHGYLAAAAAGSRAKSARVAAATSDCRIKLSPTRKALIPTSASRAKSAD